MPCNTYSSIARCGVLASPPLSSATPAAAACQLETVVDRQRRSSSGYRFVMQAASGSAVHRVEGLAISDTRWLTFQMRIAHTSSDPVVALSETRFLIAANAGHTTAPWTDGDVIQKGV